MVLCVYIVVTACICTYKHMSERLTHCLTDYATEDWFYSPTPLAEGSYGLGQKSFKHIQMQRHNQQSQTVRWS